MTGKNGNINDAKSSENCSSTDRGTADRTELRPSWETAGCKTITLNKEVMQIGETWISKLGTEAVIVKIEECFVWCESDFWRNAYPVEKDEFLRSMKFKSSTDIPVCESGA